MGCIQTKLRADNVGSCSNNVSRALTQEATNPLPPSPNDTRYVLGIRGHESATVGGKGVLARLVVAQGHAVVAVFEGHASPAAARFCRDRCWEALASAVDSQQAIPAAAALTSLSHSFQGGSEQLQPSPLEGTDFGPTLAPAAHSLSATLLHIDIASRTVTVAMLGPHSSAVGLACSSFSRAGGNGHGSFGQFANGVSGAAGASHAVSAEARKRKWHPRGAQATGAGYGSDADGSGRLRIERVVSLTPSRGAPHVAPAGGASGDNAASGSPCGCDVRTTSRQLAPGDDLLVLLAGGGGNGGAGRKTDTGNAGARNGDAAAEWPPRHSGVDAPAAALPAARSALAVASSSDHEERPPGSAAPALSLRDAVLLAHELTPPCPSGCASSHPAPRNPAALANGHALGLEVLYDSNQQAIGHVVPGVGAADTHGHLQAGDAAALAVASHALAVARRGPCVVTQPDTGSMSLRDPTASLACFILRLDWSSAGGKPGHKAPPPAAAATESPLPALTPSRRRWELLRAYCRFLAARRRHILAAWYDAAQAAAAAAAAAPLPPKASVALAGILPVRSPSFASRPPIRLGSLLCPSVEPAAAATVPARTASFTSRGPVMMEFVEELATPTPSVRGGDGTIAAVYASGAGRSIADAAVSTCAAAAALLGANASVTALGAAAAVEDEPQSPLSPSGFAAPYGIAGLVMKPMGSSEEDEDYACDSLAECVGFGAAHAPRHDSYQHQGRQPPGPSRRGVGVGGLSMARPLSRSSPNLQAPLAELQAQLNAFPRRSDSNSECSTDGGGAAKTAPGGVAATTAAAAAAAAAAEEAIAFSRHSAGLGPLSVGSNGGGAEASGSGGAIDWSLVMTSMNNNSAGHTPIPSSAANRMQPSTVYLELGRRSAAVGGTSSGGGGSESGGLAIPRAAPGALGGVLQHHMQISGRPLSPHAPGVGMVSFPRRTARLGGGGGGGGADGAPERQLSATAGGLSRGSIGGQLVSDEDANGGGGADAGVGGDGADGDMLSEELPALRIESTAELAALMAEIVITDDGEVVRTGGGGAAAAAGLSSPYGGGRGGVSHMRSGRSFSRQGSRGWTPRLAIVREDAREANCTSTSCSNAQLAEGLRFSAISEERGSSRGSGSGGGSGGGSGSGSGSTSNNTYDQAPTSGSDRSQSASGNNSAPSNVQTSRATTIVSSAGSSLEEPMGHRSAAGGADAATFAPAADATDSPSRRPASPPSRALAAPHVARAAPDGAAGVPVRAALGLGAGSDTAAVTALAPDGQEAVLRSPFATSQHAAAHLAPSAGAVASAPSPAGARDEPLAAVPSKPFALPRDKGTAAVAAEKDAAATARAALADVLQDLSPSLDRERLGEDAAASSGGAGRARRRSAYSGLLIGLGSATASPVSTSAASAVAASVSASFSSQLPSQPPSQRPARLRSSVSASIAAAAKDALSSGDVNPRSGLLLDGEFPVKERASASAAASSAAATAAAEVPERPVGQRRPKIGRSRSRSSSGLAPAVLAHDAELPGDAGGGGGGADAAAEAWTIVGTGGVRPTLGMVGRSRSALVARAHQHYDHPSHLLHSHHHHHHSNSTQRADSRTTVDPSAHADDPHHAAVAGSHAGAATVTLDRSWSVGSTSGPLGSLLNSTLSKSSLTGLTTTAVPTPGCTSAQGSNTRLPTVTQLSAHLLASPTAAVASASTAFQLAGSGAAGSGGGGNVSGPGGCHQHLRTLPRSLLASGSACTSAAGASAACGLGAAVDIHARTRRLSGGPAPVPLLRATVTATVGAVSAAQPPAPHAAEASEPRAAFRVAAGLPAADSAGVPLQHSVEGPSRSFSDGAATDITLAEVGPADCPSPFLTPSLASAAASAGCAAGGSTAGGGGGSLMRTQSLTLPGAASVVLSSAPSRTSAAPGSAAADGAAGAMMSYDDGVGAGAAARSSCMGRSDASCSVMNSASAWTATTGRTFTHNIDPWVMSSSRRVGGVSGFGAASSNIGGGGLADASGLIGVTAASAYGSVSGLLLTADAGAPGSQTQLLMQVGAGGVNSGPVGGGGSAAGLQNAGAILSGSPGNAGGYMLQGMDGAGEAYSGSAATRALMASGGQVSRMAPHRGSQPQLSCHSHDQQPEQYQHQQQHRPYPLETHLLGHSRGAPSPQAHTAQRPFAAASAAPSTRTKSPHGFRGVSANASASVPVPKSNARALLPPTLLQPHAAAPTVANSAGLRGTELAGETQTLAALMHRAAVDSTSCNLYVSDAGINGSDAAAAAASFGFQHPAAAAAAAPQLPPHEALATGLLSTGGGGAVSCSTNAAHLSPILMLNASRAGEVRSPVSGGGREGYMADALLAGTGAGPVSGMRLLDTVVGLETDEA